MVTLAEQLKDNTAFNTACAELGVNPTKRQLSKWLRNTGIVYKMVILKKDLYMDLKHLMLTKKETV